MIESCSVSLNTKDVRTHVARHGMEYEVNTRDHILVRNPFDLWCVDYIKNCTPMKGKLMDTFTALIPAAGVAISSVTATVSRKQAVITAAGARTNIGDMGTCFETWDR